MSYRSDLTPPAEMGPLVVAATVSVPLAARVMRRRGLDSLAVIDHGSVCGVVTECDLLRAAVARRRVAEVNVGEVCCRELTDLMTPNPVVLSSHTTVASAVRVMMEAGAGSAVAMGDEGVTGVVSGRDILAAAGEGMDPNETTVEDVSVQVTSLSASDGVGRAVEAVVASGGRPVPVVDDGQPVATVRVAFSSIRASRDLLRPGPTAATNVIRRQHGATRFDAPPGN